MVVEKPWAKHYQSDWHERAWDTGLPLWLRVTCLAYGHHEANGHANFRRGQLLWMLGTPPTADSPFKAAPGNRVCEAIADAVKRGWLAEGSRTECLVVPAHAIGGGLGNPNKPCPVHTRKRKTRRRKP
jgi:hypothetical protein